MYLHGCFPTLLRVRLAVPVQHSQQASKDEIVWWTAYIGTLLQI